MRLHWSSFHHAFSPCSEPFLVFQRWFLTGKTCTVSSQSLLCNLSPVRVEFLASSRSLCPVPAGCASNRVGRRQGRKRAQPMQRSALPQNMVGPLDKYIHDSNPSFVEGRCRGCVGSRSKREVFFEGAGGTALAKQRRFSLPAFLKGASAAQKRSRATQPNGKASTPCVTRSMFNLSVSPLVV